VRENAPWGMPISTSTWQYFVPRGNDFVAVIYYPTKIVGGIDKAHQICDITLIDEYELTLKSDSHHIREIWSSMIIVRSYTSINAKQFKRKP
jgi:hypothetical protein